MPSQPIQEDETALVLFALWQDYVRHGDIELPQSLYRDLIRRSARFMSSYIEADLNLPKPSYDLWEERYGIYTFTASAVYGGLIAADQLQQSVRRRGTRLTVTATQRNVSSPAFSSICGTKRKAASFGGSISITASG